MVVLIIIAIPLMNSKGSINLKDISCRNSKEQFSRFHLLKYIFKMSIYRKL